MKQLLANRNYIKLLLGYSLSIFVDSIVFMLAIKQVEVLDNRTASYTALYWFHYLPSVLFSLWIGAWISFKKIENIMRNTLFIRILVLGMFIAGNGFDNLTLIYIYIFLESLFSIFILPSTDTLVTKIVNQEKRTEANALVKLGFVLMQILGYGVTTVLIKREFSLMVILITCVSLLIIGVIAISKINVVYRVNVNSVNTSIRSELKELRGYLWNKRIVLNVFILFALAWLVASSIDIIVISYLTQIAMVSSENFGIVAICVFVGMVLGALSATYVYEKFSLRSVFSLPLIIYTFTVMSMFLFDNWLYTLPFFLLGGISLGLFEVSFTTFLQDYNEPKYYTRIFSIQTLILSTMPLPGLLFLGTIIQLYGITSTILTISILLATLSITGTVLLRTNNHRNNHRDGSPAHRSQ